MSWIEIEKPAPVLNTPDFKSVFRHSPDPIHYEFVALPGMRFEVLEELDLFILKIQWPAYSPNPLFIDSRFCTIASGAALPISFSGENLLSHMESRLGAAYVWGGNYAPGIPAMLEYYPPKNKLDSRTEKLWTFRGIDCSGLLFEATNGATPRNTSHLIHFGRSLEPDEPKQPLDMIIYPGHVLFIRDDETIIESKSPFGVRICPLQQRLDEIAQERLFIRNWGPTVDPTSHFTIRRFT